MKLTRSAILLFCAGLVSPALGFAGAIYFDFLLWFGLATGLGLCTGSAFLTIAPLQWRFVCAPFCAAAYSIVLCLSMIIFGLTAGR
jgi:hypothetical protein